MVLDSSVPYAVTFNSSRGNYTIGSRGEAEFFQGLLDENKCLQSGSLGRRNRFTRDGEGDHPTSGSTSLGTGGVIQGGINLQSGSLVGTGTVNGDVVSASDVAPATPGIITIDGNYSQSSAGSLDIQIAGTSRRRPTSIN